MMNKQEFYNKVTEQTGIELSEKQKNQYQRYYELVVEWNQKINLTAITEEEEFYSKHFYDSISLAFSKIIVMLIIFVMLEAEQDSHQFH